MAEPTEFDGLTLTWSKIGGTENYGDEKIPVTDEMIAEGRMAAIGEDEEGHAPTNCGLIAIFRAMLSVSAQYVALPHHEGEMGRLRQKNAELADLLEISIAITDRAHVALATFRSLVPDPVPVSPLVRATRIRSDDPRRLGPV